MKSLFANMDLKNLKDNFLNVIKLIDKLAFNCLLILLLQQEAV